jgi:hypothetical protein
MESAKSINGKSYFTLSAGSVFYEDILDENSDIIGVRKHVLAQDTCIYFPEEQINVEP